MSSTATSFISYPGAIPGAIEDPLSLLPRAPVREFAAGTPIYRPEDRPDSLFLIIDGRVKVSRLAGESPETILDFYHKDDFFGESAFLGAGRRGEQALALDRTSVMSWSAAELSRLMTRSPALGPALLRVVAEKLAEANDRIQGFCLDPIHRRLVKGLLHLARRFGEPAEGSRLRLAPTTHEQLARYVGTSREIVTQSMNQFRRQGLLDYSRRGVDVEVAALEKYLRE